MMRVLRASNYSHPRQPPTIAFVTEDQTSDTLESVRYGVRVPGCLTLCDIFELPEGETPMTASAERSHKLAKVERDQVILYFYLADQLAQLDEGVSARTPGPTPLSRQHVAEVLEQLALHPAFERNRLGVPDDTGALVILGEDGRVE